MNIYKLQSKIVIGRNGKKIGTIIRIDDSVIIGDDETSPFAIIKLHPLLYRGKLFPMPLHETTEYHVMGNEVRLTITKKQFMVIFKQYLAEQKRKIKAAKIADTNKIDAALAMSYFGKV